MITLRSLPTSQVFVKAICELVLEPVHEVKRTIAVDRRTSNRFDSGYDKEHGFAPAWISCDILLNSALEHSFRPNLFLEAEKLSESHLNENFRFFFLTLSREKTKYQTLFSRWEDS